MIDTPHAGLPVDIDGFGALLTKIERERGVPCGGYKDRCLRRRVSVRLRATGVHTFGDYAGLLDREPGEWERLLSALTINVTRFFRDGDVYTLLERHVYPELRAQVPGAIRAWSAGCSQGMEALSLAMGLAECVGPERVDVLATDVDVDSLAAASVGAYSDVLMADVPAARRDRWFHRRASTVGQAGTPGAWVACDELRERVRVTRHDLLRESAPTGHFHLIACRNVIIYFDRHAQAALFTRLHDALAPGGVLVLGMVETLVGPARDLLMPIDSRLRVYRRASEGAA